MVRKMTLGEFIERMLNGWGFRRPYRVQVMGIILDKIIPEEDRGIEVEVEFVSSHYGWGPNFHYVYTWNVSGYNLPEGATGGYSTSVERVFGGKGVNIYNTDTGFQCQYEW
ncbi:MAG: hypothetical protein QXO46_08265 [Nitrososphaerota archaeon]